MKLERPLFEFDLETTGTDPATDRICQFAFRRVDVDGSTLERVRLVNPTIPIPAAATACHHITDEMVKDANTFRQISKSVLSLLQGCDVAGFNIGRFDVPLLWEELNRAGLFWDMEGVRIIDPYMIWAKMMPRKLINAAAEFCPEREYSETELHDAKNDTEVLHYVLMGQLERWPQLASVDAIAELCKRTIQVDGEELERVDLAGALARRPDGTVIFTHQKVRGQAVIHNQHYADWMITKDFSENTKGYLRALLATPEAQAERRASAERHRRKAS